MTRFVNGCIYLLVALVIVSICLGAYSRMESTKRCNAAGGIVIRDPFQCVREGKPVPDSLWRGR